MPELGLHVDASRGCGYGLDRGVPYKVNVNATGIRGCPRPRNTEIRVDTWHFVVAGRNERIASQKFALAGLCGTHFRRFEFDGRADHVWLSKVAAKETANTTHSAVRLTIGADGLQPLDAGRNDHFALRAKEVAGLTRAKDWRTACFAAEPKDGAGLLVAATAGSGTAHVVFDYKAKYVAKRRDSRCADSP